MKRYCSVLKCEAEFDTPALVQVCPDCALGEDAWRHWFVIAPSEAKDAAGRISREIADAVHSVINAEFGGIINVKSIDQAAKLHLQRQADVALQQQEAAENLARQKSLEREQAIAAREFVADHWLADRLQASQKKSVIQRLAEFFHF